MTMTILVRPVGSQLNLMVLLAVLCGSVMDRAMTSRFDACRWNGALIWPASMRGI